jgi:hypothetical protein
MTALSQKRTQRPSDGWQEQGWAMAAFDSKRSNVRSSVLVVAGPFASFKGVVRDVDAVRDELSVEVTMFGRPVPIQAAFQQVMLR